MNNNERLMIFLIQFFKTWSEKFHEDVSLFNSNVICFFATLYPSFGFDKTTGDALLRSTQELDTNTKCKRLLKQISYFIKPFSAGKCSQLDKQRLRTYYTYETFDSLSKSDFNIFKEFVINNYQEIYADLDQYTSIINSLKDYLRYIFDISRSMTTRVTAENDKADFIFYDILVDMHRFLELLENRNKFKYEVCSFFKKNDSHSSQKFCKNLPHPIPAEA
ncbi:hypothetical protein RF11_03915 [Thelohanellus kitauei]|uniref:Uncharacterized protein n=1 Tax=Thelohanellus kitauei TaxID=669202 RepID=A0A0C2JP67_THEKT|nr:hypothetical protein RF11_03915 [Thelohanellus kitauei]